MPERKAERLKRKAEMLKTEKLKDEMPERKAERLKVMGKS
jgi:hypothetical protein